MALLGNAYFIVYHNTSLQFINNRAVTKGGAIYYISSGQNNFMSIHSITMTLAFKTTPTGQPHFTSQETMQIMESQFTVLHYSVVCGVMN